MKRLPLLASIAFFPVVAVAEPSTTNIGSDAGQWVWCQPDAQGRTGAGTPERAELLISGTSLSGRLLVNDREYARIEGVIKPASKNSGFDGATTRVWEITATETTGGNGHAEHKLVLKGSYTKYQSAENDPSAHVGSYETLALWSSDKEGAAVIISRVQAASPLRFAAR